MERTKKEAVVGEASSKLVAAALKSFDSPAKNSQRSVATTMNLGCRTSVRTRIR
ncbi:MAG: hypothetical protein FWE23_01385 [Chitinivibrionia bacterium]|nr:hypothetical protein [Chitinivibrionia bacterium]